MVKYWPADIIQSSTLGKTITGQPGGKITPAHRHALERRGIRGRKKPVKIGGNAARVAILRNPEQWEGADAYLIAAELAKVSQPMGLALGAPAPFWITSRRHDPVTPVTLVTPLLFRAK